MFTAALPRSVPSAGLLFQLRVLSDQAVGSTELIVWMFGLASVVNSRNLTVFTVPVMPLTLNVR